MFVKVVLHRVIVYTQQYLQIEYGLPIWIISIRKPTNERPKRVYDVMKTFNFRLTSIYITLNFSLAYVSNGNNPTNTSLVRSTLLHGPLARPIKLPVAYALGTPGTFSPSQRVNDSDMHHDTCVTHLPWCMLGSLNSGFLWSRWQGKRSQHFRRMRNPQFYESGKRPIAIYFRSIICGTARALSYTLMYIFSSSYFNEAGKNQFGICITPTPHIWFFSNVKYHELELWHKHAHIGEKWCQSLRQHSQQTHSVINT